MGEHKVSEASRFASSRNEANAMEESGVDQTSRFASSGNEANPDGSAALRRRAIFLDRDGVINRPLIRDGKPYPPSSLDEFEILPGVPEACQLLAGLGFLLIVVTNQPDVGRGSLSRDAVETIHARLAQQLPVERIMTCYHAGAAYGDKCECRKPRPGMLFRAASELQIDLAESYMIGDRWRDVECGLNAGCGTIFVDWGYEEKLKRSPDYQVADLAEAATLIQTLISTSPNRR
jgi:D-glycero-D-manno-heptose 1,7-bisphosphate phosphatase